MVIFSDQHLEISKPLIAINLFCRQSVVVAEETVNYLQERSSELIYCICISIFLDRVRSFWIQSERHSAGGASGTKLEFMKWISLEKSILHRVEVVKLKGHAGGSAAFKEIMILDLRYGITLLLFRAGISSVNIVWTVQRSADEKTHCFLDLLHVRLWSFI
jgi:hypothetical protein